LATALVLPFDIHVCRNIAKSISLCMENGKYFGKIADKQ